MGFIMKKSLLFVLSLICLPCLGDQFQLLINIRTSLNQKRHIIGSCDSESRQITTPYPYINNIASKLASDEAMLIVDGQMMAAHGTLIAIKKLDVEIPVPVNGAAFDQLQRIMNNQLYSTAYLDQVNTVKMINTSDALGKPKAINDLLLNHCVDLFIAHPEQRCPFEFFTQDDDSDNPSVFIKNSASAEAARNILYHRFRQHVLPIASGWQIVGRLEHPGRIRSSAYAPNGQELLTICNDNNVHIWAHNGTLLHSLLHLDHITSAAYSPDGQYIITSCFKGKVRIFGSDGAPLHTFQHPNFVHSVSFSPDSNHFITSCQDGNVRIWDANSKKIIHHPSAVYSATYSPDGQRIISTCEDCAVRMWSIDGALLQTLPHPDFVYSAKFSPDGQYIITACRDGIVRIWNHNSTLLHILQHPGAVYSAIYSPDGQQILTASNDNNVRFWRANGTLLQTLQHPDVVYSAAYSPDGQYITTACEDGSARLWRIAWVQQITFSPDSARTELGRIAFMARIALDPQFTAQEIANLQPLYQNLPEDQRAWVDGQTHNGFVRALPTPQP